MTKIFEDKTELEATRAYHRVILKAAYDSFEEYPGAGDWGKLERAMLKYQDAMVNAKREFDKEGKATGRYTLDF